MVKKSKGSLLGSSSRNSKGPGLFIVAIVAIVAVVSLFLMTQSSQQTTLDVSEEAVVVDEEGNVVGMAKAWGSGFKNVEKHSKGTFEVSEDVFNSLVGHYASQAGGCPEMCKLNPCGGLCPSKGCCLENITGAAHDRCGI